MMEKNFVNSLEYKFCPKTIHYTQEKRLWSLQRLQSDDREK